MVNLSYFILSAIYALSTVQWYKNKVEQIKYRSKRLIIVQNLHVLAETNQLRHVPDSVISLKGLSFSAGNKILSWNLRNYNVESHMLKLKHSQYF